jgi:hypothetical protein
MVLVVDAYRPSYAVVGDEARRGAAGIALRENLDRSIGRSQDQQQFDAGIAQRYAGMQQQQQQAEADRLFRAEAMQYEAAQRQQMQANEEAGYGRRLQLQAEAENQQQEMQFSSRQKAELSRIDGNMAEVEKLASRGDLDPTQAQYARYQLQSQRLGIEPMEPKPRAMEEFPALSLPDGRKVWVEPGRAGGNALRNQQTGRLIEDEAAEELERWKVVQTSQAKENQQAAAVAEKLSQSQIKQAETVQKMDFEQRKFAAQMKVERAKFIAKLTGDTKKSADGLSEVAVHSPEQIEALANQAFPDEGPQQGGLVRVTTREEAMRLPPGTKFIDPNGVERVRP